MTQYQSLYRKWRPKSFEDVVGQNHITRTLKNAIKLKRIANSYLFSVTRGVGKTTTARILAKALNCQWSTATLQQVYLLYPYDETINGCLGN